MNPIPTDLRHLQPASAFVRIIEGHDLALDQPEALVAAKLLTFTHQKLHPQTDADERRAAGGRVLKNADQI